MCFGSQGAPVRATLHQCLQQAQFEHSGGQAQWLVIKAAWQELYGTSACAPVPVLLWRPLAEAVLHAGWTCLGAVAISSRPRLSNFLCHGMPPRAMVKAFLALERNPAEHWSLQVPAQPAASAGTLANRLKAELDPHKIVPFIRATASLKDLESAGDAMMAALEALLPDSFQQLSQTVDKLPCRTLLLQSRIRLDCVCMLLGRWRWSHEASTGAKIWRSLGYDASPQLGLEIFGGLVEECTGSTHLQSVRSIKLPLATLGFGHTRTQDKRMCLLWQLWLLAGPSMKSMRAWLGTVRTSISDWGTESGMLDAPDLLPQFFGDLTGKPCTEAAQPGTFLFPRAVWVPGWNHIWSNILKDVCGKLDWFPSFLTLLRHCVRFFRSVSYRQCIASAVQLLDSQKELLQKFSASFARWRWSTLTTACADVWGLEFLRDHWPKLHREAFSNAKDATNAEAVNTAFTSDEFWKQLWFLKGLAKSVEDRRMWGAGCPCHGAELRQGKRVQCIHKGRRLPEAREFIKASSEQFLENARHLTLAMFGGDESLLMDGVRCLTYVAGMSSAKFDFLNHLPYLLACADEPEVCKLILQEFDALEESQHHRVSVQACSKLHTSLRADIEACAETGLCSQALLDERNAIAAVRLSEDVVEGTHRGILREKTRANAAKLPWISASERLGQNLATYDELKDAPGGEDAFAAEWRRWKRLVQAPGRSLNFMRNKKLPHASFYAKVYRMVEHSQTDWSDIWKAPSATKRTDAVRVQAEYLNKVIEARAFYSLPLQDQDADKDGQQDLMVFQVLEKVPMQKKFIKSGAPLVVPVLLQHFDVWSSRHDSLEVHLGHTASVSDLLKLAPFTALRVQLSQWKAQVSDLEGCIALTDRAAVECALAPTDEGCPELLVLEAVKAAGWVPGKRTCPHWSPLESEAEKKILVVEPGRNGTLYYQCLLAKAELRGRGLRELHCKELKMYYQCILKAPNPAVVRPGQQNIQYQQFLAFLDSGSSDIAFPAVAQGPLALPAAQGATALPAPPLASMTDGGIIEDELFEPPADDGSDSDRSSSSRSTSTSSEEEGIIEDAEAVPDYPGKLEGCSLHYDVFDGRGNAGYKRLRLICTLHQGCGKYRSVGSKQTAALGPREPLAYLAVWFRMGTPGMSKKEHIKQRPSPAAMQEWLNASRV